MLARFLKRRLAFLFWPIQLLGEKVGFGLTTAGFRRTRPGEYGLCYPYPFVTFTPWFGAEFQKKIEPIKNRTMCTEDRLYTIEAFVKHCLHLEGDFAECGTYRGGTAVLISEAIKHSGKEFHLFDTFQGMPSTAIPATDSMKEGDLGDTSLQEVTALLKGYDFVSIHPGFIPDTLVAAKDKRFAFVHMDLDIYQSTRDALNFFYERIVPGGALLFDDYGFLDFKHGAKAAVDEFFSDKPEKPIQLHTSQCLVLKH